MRSHLLRLITLLLFSFAVPAALAAPEEITVSSLKELIKVVRKVSTGKTIVVAPGVYELPQQLNFKGRGTASHPVVLKALEPGKTVFCGSGRMRIENSSWIRVEGFLFKGTGGIYCEDSEHVQITENRFLMEDTEDTTEKLHWVQFKFSRHVRVDHCEFGRRSSAGAYIHFSPGNRYARIDHNYFHDYKELGANDGSSIYLHGDGKWAHYAILEQNLFTRCNGEHELICIKSHRNVIRRNTFLNCKGAVSIRDGNYNDVYSNIFLASDEPNAGAVRIHGKFNVFANNYLEDIDEPIECCWGDTDPPHMADELGPGKLAFEYRASPNNLIAHNSFVKCNVVFHWYKKGIELQTITPKLKNEALEPFLIDFWEKETSSHRRGDIIDPPYSPRGWYIYNNLIINTPQLVSTKAVRGASVPVREKDFRWIGNISSKGIDTGQWRSLHAHQLELIDLGTMQGADGVLELRKRRPVGSANELAAFWTERNGDDENLKAVLSLNEFIGTEKDNTLELNDVGTSW